MLTPRELAVARLLSRDLSNQQIARELGLAETTVKTHLRRASEKLGCQSRVGVAIWYIKSVEARP